MAQVYYTALIERGTHGFGVFFPDLPGCVSYGDTVEDAAHNAAEALAGHLLVMADNGDPIPDPSSPDAIEHDPDVQEVARMLVAVEKPGRKIRVNVMLDEGLVAAIDKAAANRSRFLSDAARTALRNASLTA